LDTFVNNKLRSIQGQKFLNGCLVTFIEREFFLQAKDQDIISYFQTIKDRKVKLWLKFVSFLIILLFYPLYI